MSTAGMVEEDILWKMRWCFLLLTCLFLGTAGYIKSRKENLYASYGFLGGSDGEESTCNAGDPGSVLGSRRSPGGGNGTLTPVFLPGEFHGQGSLAGSSL